MTDYPERLKAMARSGPAGDPESWTGLKPAYSEELDALPDDVREQVVQGSFDPPDVEVRSFTVNELVSCGPHLFREHAAECEPDLAHQLQVDVAFYRAAEREGKLIVAAVLAWEERKRFTPVGHAVATLSRHPHYSRIFARLTAIYLQPEFRKGSTGLQLLKRVVNEAKARGATRMLAPVKPDTQAEELLIRLGFRVEETVLGRDL